MRLNADPTITRAIGFRRTASRASPGFLASPAWLPRLALAGLLIASPLVLARAELEQQTQALLVEAVEAAAAVDFYHARCRGDVSGRQTDNLNKLIVSRLRTTVLTVQDDFFPEHGYRRVQQRLEQDFLELLEEAGGCQGAKDSGLPERLRARYESALEAIRALP